ncbi:MAG: EutN/CcmL family microcompartment protein [Planctomycetes bacterium]|nr:EutN/CcmL family microcompartment protein [Planctomycetota bacterium]
MILARVTGTVVSTQKNPHLAGHRLLVVHPIDLDGKLVSTSFLAVDVVDAGVGDRVLVIDDGGSARIALHDEGAPLRNVVVGVVDDIEVDRGYLA